VCPKFRGANLFGFSGARRELVSTRCADRYNRSVKCFVTGASGFVGGNLVHELTRQGHRVRVLLRPGADVRGLQGVEVERVEGDITDKSEQLAEKMRGCEWCFHVAASYALWLPDYRPMFAANVLGTQKIIRAAVKAGCSRIVYTSTVGCIGLPKPTPEGKIVPTDESTPVSETQMTNPYKLSKWQAEVAARELAEQGAPVIIVNPSAPVGPRDVKPTPTGRMILDFRNGAMPAYLDTGLNFVHVRDVAAGHVLAAEKGRIGERYILGAADGNLTMKQAFEHLGRITGRPAPRFQVPYGVALAAAHVDELLAKLTGKPPKAPLAGVRMAANKMWFNPAKAIRELGLPQTNPVQALADAVTWFEQNGYVKSR
jgi:dihydroflavonol-4-reductase